MLYLTFALVLIAALFALGWYFAPSGWLSNIWTGVSLVLGGTTSLWEFLSSYDFFAVDLMTQAQAAIVALASGSLLWLSRNRAKIKAWLGSRGVS